MTSATTSSTKGNSIQIKCTREEEIDATISAMNRYTDEWLKTSLWRFSKRRQLVKMIKHASEHLEKVLNEYKYDG